MSDPLEEKSDIELKPVTHITTDAIGPAGKRVFYIQAWKEDLVVTVIVEKFQLQTLAVGIEQFLAELRQRIPMMQEAPTDFDEEKMRIIPPVEPLFRVSEFSLNYDSENDLLGLIAREIPAQADDPTTEVRFWANRSQIRAMISWGLEVVNRGRPSCIQCGEPEDPAGHFCARKNGHKY